MSESDQRDPDGRVADVPDNLERGREAYGRRVWADAYRSLSLAMRRRR